MDELKKILDIAVTGEQREKAIKEFKGYLAGWGMTMPPAEILVQDFGLGDFKREGLIECWVANETTAGYCGKFLFVFDGQSCPRHHHREKHETFFVVKGAVRMRTARRSRLLREGAVFPVPPGVFHSFTASGPALLLEVSQPSIRRDNFFKDKRVAGTGVI